MGILSQRHFKLFVSSLMENVMFVLVCERPQSMSIVLPLMNGGKWTTFCQIIVYVNIYKYVSVHLLEFVCF